VLESYVRKRLLEKGILLMTHLVVGYPSLDGCREMVRAMVEAGVDLVELQIPFSEPVADGPVILRANHGALKTGITVKACLEFAGEMAASFAIPFLVMTYYNIPFRFGLDNFARVLSEKGLYGVIVPDLPPEEAEHHVSAMRKEGLGAVFILSPETSVSRMARITETASGFVYCVARRGVTGARTRFSPEIVSYLARCRKVSPLPIAVGFGLRERADLNFLRGKADIAVIGTETIRAMEREGADGVRAFMRGLV